MRKFVFLILLTYTFKAFTQGITLEYATGYGKFQLNDIRSLQKSMVGTLDVKITDDFPGYITNSLSLGYSIGAHHFGGNFAYFTTGGRLNRTDYSGYFNIDMLVKAYRFGAFYRKYLNAGLDPLKFYIQLSPGFVNSELLVIEKLKVYTFSEEETSFLSGKGLYIEPSIGASLKITKFLQLNLSGGYQFDFPGLMIYKQQPTEILTNWEGIRLNGGLTLILPTN